MNLDEYRAIKAQESSDQPAAQQATETTPEPTNEPVVNEETTPSKLVIDGLGEVDPSEIAEWKRGYMRTQDYTKKTQEVAAQRKEAEQALQFYQQAQEQGGQVEFNPFTQKLEQLESELTNFKVEKEIEGLQAKYKDFDAMEVLNVAMEKGFGTLEEAYFFSKGSKVTNEPVDQEQLKRSIREEVLREIEEQRKANTSIISTSDTQPPAIQEEPTLTPEQDRVRQKLGMSIKDYLKWG